MNIIQQCVKSHSNSALTINIVYIANPPVVCEWAIEACCVCIVTLQLLASAMVHVQKDCTLAL